MAALAAVTLTAASAPRLLARLKGHGIIPRQAGSVPITDAAGLGRAIAAAGLALPEALLRYLLKQPGALVPFNTPPRGPAVGMQPPAKLPTFDPPPGGRWPPHYALKKGKRRKRLKEQLQAFIDFTNSGEFQGYRDGEGAGPLTQANYRNVSARGTGGRWGRAAWP